ncbi:hypothetical protein C8J57DRAFT_1485417 [Mycena rebaudengoi]|nr:hypothetical protein C8J57DRAFT_1485417 [Mycena rebaudengoi]
MDPPTAHTHCVMCQRSLAGADARMLALVHAINVEVEKRRNQACERCINLELECNGQTPNCKACRISKTPSACTYGTTLVEPQTPEGNNGQSYLPVDAYMCFPLSPIPPNQESVRKRKRYTPDLSDEPDITDSSTCSGIKDTGPDSNNRATFGPDPTPEIGYVYSPATSLHNGDQETTNYNIDQLDLSNHHVSPGLDEPTPVDSIAPTHATSYNPHPATSYHTLRNGYTAYNLERDPNLKNVQDFTQVELKNTNDIVQFNPFASRNVYSASDAWTTTFVETSMQDENSHMAFNLNLSDPLTSYSTAEHNSTWPGTELPLQPSGLASSHNFNSLYGVDGYPDFMTTEYSESVKHPEYWKL